MLYGKLCAGLAIVCSLVLLAVIACNGDEQASGAGSVPVPEVSVAATATASPPDIASPASAEASKGGAPATPAPAVSSTPVSKRPNTPFIPVSTPDIPATVAAEVYIRRQVEEQVNAAVKADSTPAPDPASPEGLLVELVLPPGPLMAGDKPSLEFTVTNQLAIPVYDVTIEFEPSKPSTLDSLRTGRGDCADSVCQIPVLAGNEFVTGRATLSVELSLETGVSLQADTSWHSGDSKTRNFFTQLSRSVRQGEGPGSLLWNTPVSSRSVGCDKEAAVDYETVYAQFGEKILAVSRTNGNALWTYRAGNNPDPFALAGNSIFFTNSVREGERNYNNYLYSLDTATGSLNWRTRLEKGTVWGPPLVYRDAVYVTVRGPFVNYAPEYGYLMSFDASTGDLNWSLQVEDGAGTPPMESDGSIYFFNSADLFQVDHVSGELERKYDAPGRIYGPPALHGNKAYITTTGGSIYSWDLATDETIWEYKPVGGNVSDTPVVSGGYIYFLVYDEVAEQRLSMEVLDSATGAPVWKYRPGGRLRNPSVANGRVYIGSGDRFAALDGETGETDWSAYYHHVCDKVALVDGVLYVRSTDGGQQWLLAIRENSKAGANAGNPPAPLNPSDGVLASTRSLWSQEPQVVMAIEPTQGSVADGNEWKIYFTLVNRSSEPANDFRIAFEVTGQGQLVDAVLSGGKCSNSVCMFRSLAGGESITGHLSVDPVAWAKGEVTVQSDYSWLPANNTRRSTFAYETVRRADSSEAGSLVWTAKLESGGMSCSDHLTVAGQDSIYPVYRRAIYALSRSDGAVKWRLDGDIQMFSPVLDGETIFVHGSESGEGWRSSDFVRSIDVSTGAENWRHPLEEQLFSHLLVNDAGIYFTVRDYIGDGNSNYSELVALEKSTGAEKWRYRVDGKTGGQVTQLDGNIYFPTSGPGDNYLHSINALTGELDRKYAILGESLSLPQLYGGEVYLVSRSNEIYSMDLATGETGWHYRPNESVSRISGRHEGTLFLLLYSRAERGYVAVEAVDTKTGSLIWRYQPGEKLQSLSVLEGNIYVSTFTSLTSLNGLTGNVKWQTGHIGICGSMASADGYLYGRASSDETGMIAFAIRGD